jgi:hypothetical protein
MTATCPACDVPQVDGLRGVNRVAGMIDDILAAVVRYRADQ